MVYTWKDREELINQAQKDFAAGKITEFPVIELPNHPPPYSRCEFRFQWIEELGRCSVPNCPHCNNIY